MPVYCVVVVRMECDKPGAVPVHLPGTGVLEYCSTVVLYLEPGTHMQYAYHSMMRADIYGMLALCLK